ncbi:lipocalin-like domain-containing protein [Frankia sp. B2]|uniref:lipocalin-like domain-containing protein n=1 Tax=Frankia sp. B2 TaxID=2541730 RepID=UPI00141A8B8A|nr:lipocalin-like domain-containing protein [Frankia sp. B2]
MSGVTSSDFSDHLDTHGPLLVGAWKLVSFIVTDRNGIILSMPMGTQPSGLVIYAADGHMSAHLRDPQRHTSSASVSEFMNSSQVDAESIAMNHPYIGYCGTYCLEDDQVIHHVQVASVPEWIGGNQVRNFALRENVLTLCCPAKWDGSGIRLPYLTWERIRPAESPAGATVAP